MSVTTPSSRLPSPGRGSRFRGSRLPVCVGEEGRDHNSISLPCVAPSAKTIVIESKPQNRRINTGRAATRSSMPAEYAIIGKGSIGHRPSRNSPYTLATFVATQPYGDPILSIDHQEMPIVSGPDQKSERIAPYAIGVRITDEGAELFHIGTYVGDDPVLKATFAGSWLQI